MGEPTAIPELANAGAPSAWSADGKWLYFLRVQQCAIHRFELSSRHLELWKKLPPADEVGVIGCSALTMTPDARSYAYQVRRSLSTLYMLEGLR